MILKTVTLQEANGLLPLVKERFFRIHVLLAESQRLQEKEDRVLEKPLVITDKPNITLAPAKGKKSSSGRKFRFQIRDLEYLIQEEVQALLSYGVVIKGLFPPHVDFLSVRNHEIIYLCWHGGEKEISHWHTVDDGFPGRHGILEPKQFGPFRVH